ncbi:hypothetical protein C8R43DRAFT_945163 [Mycena crocata]|nr:hypothetical protein C8R43DRAFT_945163 [Mycena crocata]
MALKAIGTQPLIIYYLAAVFCGGFIGILMNLLREVLRSNSIPEEASHLRSVVHSSPGDIEFLQQLLDRLKSERAALQEYCTEYNVGCNALGRAAQPWGWRSGGTMHQTPRAEFREMAYRRSPHTRISFPLLSCAKGNLPLLERLRLGGEALGKTAAGLFSVELYYLRHTLEVLPWGQFRYLTYANIDGEDLLGDGLAVVGRLPPSTSFSVCSLDLCYLDVATSVLPPVCSGTQHFRLGLCDSEIVRSGSADRSLGSSVGDWPVFWSQEQFLRLASRSSFPSNLTDLSLHDVVVTVEDLIGCLSTLPALSQLFIQGVPQKEDSPRNTLVTDSPFRRLAWTLEPNCLVPHLTTLGFISFFAFDKVLWLEFVTSRLGLRRDDDDTPFTINKARHSGHEPEIDEEVMARITELRDLDELSWWFRPDEEDGGRTLKPDGFRGICYYRGKGGRSTNTSSTNISGFNKYKEHNKKLPSESPYTISTTRRSDYGRTFNGAWVYQDCVTILQSSASWMECGKYPADDSPCRAAGGLNWHWMVGGRAGGVIAEEEIAGGV